MFARIKIHSFYGILLGAVRDRFSVLKFVSLVSEVMSRKGLHSNTLWYCIQLWCSQYGGPHIAVSNEIKKTDAFAKEPTCLGSANVLKGISATPHEKLLRGHWKGILATPLEVCF